MEKPLIEKLTKTVRSFGELSCVLQPGFVINLYTAEPLLSICPYIADSIERFLALIGREKLTFYWADNGYRKPLTDKKLNCDLKLLRNYPIDFEGCYMMYLDSADGGASKYSVYIYASEPDETFPDVLKLIRFGFPSDALEVYGKDKIIDFIYHEAQVLSVQSGNAGFGFHRGLAFESESTKEVNMLLHFYIGFDPEYVPAVFEMNNCTSWANWINIVHNDLFKKCGGEKQLKAEAPNVELHKLKDIIIIRSSKYPPIGDISIGAKDIGELPGVARFLKPTRIELTGLGDGIFDIKSWLSRFDHLELKPWNNE